MTERHARWFETSLVRRPRSRPGPRTVHAYEAVWDDLIASLEWMQVNDPPASLPLFREMSEYSVRRGRWSEVRRSDGGCWQRRKACRATSEPRC